MLKKLNITLWNTLLTFAFFTGLALNILEVNIYRLTLIPWVIPTCIWLITGLLITPFTNKILSAEMKTHTFPMQLFFNIITWGGIVVYTFMAINFYFVRPNIVNVMVPIIKTGNLAKGRNGCGEPYTEIKYISLNKQLIFPCGIDVGDYKLVRLTMKTGILGYSVIKDKVLIR
jgi:hypothetical protein